MKKKMNNMFILLLCCHVASPVKHSLTFFLTETSGVQSFPEFMAVAFVDEVQIGDFDRSREKPELKTEWIKKLVKDHPEHLEWYIHLCLDNEYLFKVNLEGLRERFNQTGGVHILQRMSGCEWDDETGDINGFSQYGYDGEDFIAFDLQAVTWVAPKPKAVFTKLKWNTDKARSQFIQEFYKVKCIEVLKQYVLYGKSFLETPVLPSVSLLQKTPSSPVSCHTTGFYPDRAMMFWRKDGVEIHEGVDHGAILPNNDGTFQMSVDLKLSSVTPEDWKRYECVFQLSGVNSDIVTKLDKAVIRTNWEKPTDMVILTGAAVVVLAVILITAIACVAYKKKTAPDNGSEQLETLNPQS